jgi:hypothetical protein
MGVVGVCVWIWIFVGGRGGKRKIKGIRRFDT